MPYFRKPRAANAAATLGVLGALSAALLAGSTLIFPTLAVVGQSVALRSELSWYETKPLFGWTVLLPRTKDQAGATSERLAFYGAHADIVPTISVEPPRTPQQLERAVKGMVTGRYEWVGFTSASGSSISRSSDRRNWPPTASLPCGLPTVRASRSPRVPASIFTSDRAAVLVMPSASRATSR